MRKWLRLLPPLCWMLLIFLFSAAPAVESTEQSTGITGMIVDMVGHFIPIDSAGRLQMIAFLEPYVRKAAHMTEFGVLFLLWIGPVRARFSNMTKAVAIAAGICTVYAASDEYHQLFVPGRSGMVTDVCIDIFGVLLAAIVCLLSEIKKERRASRSPSGSSNS